MPEFRPVRSQAPGSAGTIIGGERTRHFLISTQPSKSSDKNFVWMIGPERGKPVGAFYSADCTMIPTGIVSTV